MITFLIILLLIAPNPGIVFGPSSTRTIDLLILGLGILLLFIFTYYDNRSIKSLTTTALKDKSIQFIILASLSVVISTLYGSMKFPEITSISDVYEIYRYVFYFVFYLLVLLYLTDLSKFFKALFITVLAIELFGILQFFNLFNINNHFGLLYTQSEKLHMMIQNQHRITSTFGNPNVYGSFLIIVLCVVLSIFYFKKESSTKFKAFLYATIILTFLSIYLTTSRTTVIVTFGLLIYIGLFQLLIRISSIKTILMKSFLLLSVFLLIGILLVPHIPYLNSAYQNVTKVITDLDDNDSHVDGKGVPNNNSKVKESLESVESFESRYDYWKHNIEKFKESPVLGVGPMKNGLSFADNSYLYILARYGILGFLIYLVFLGYIFIKSFMIALKEKNNYNRAHLASSINYFIVAYAVIGIVAESWFNVVSMVIFFILLGLLIKQEKVEI